ncbi:hypothetical protein DVK05_08065 [Halorubrum sp. Atlit-8R]|uniref:hypothetical protein n=1 Tax=unclassified Halorubrum TaxID=2642239 RepID=UPI000EF1A1C9|nr:MULTISPECIES: hypothetical protein [unclassified Halorubrum]RLM63185.1 hypothetical protein DVK08_17495 [Halorubrum sp. Atlit-9R]RLM82001.1 hypothetical protein DVK05_08065 [Halorubrum sp. Atlit-8R]
MTDDEAAVGEVTEWDGGFGWIAVPDEEARRASHALATADGVWVVDPVDADGLDDRLAELGDVVGVAVVQDRHTRDAEAVARRHDVPVAAPEWASLTREKLDGEAAPLGPALDGTDYAVRDLIRRDDWEEAALWDAAAGTLLVPETLGTLPAFTEGDAALGVHPAIDDPPDWLADVDPDRVLVGHGASVHEDASAALAAAVGDR